MQTSLKAAARVCVKGLVSHDHAHIKELKQTRIKKIEHALVLVVIGIQMLSLILIIVEICFCLLKHDGTRTLTLFTTALVFRSADAKEINLPDKFI